MIALADWRVQRLSSMGATLRFNHYAEAGDVLAENPDVVIIATGGLPNIDVLQQGNNLVHSSWDIVAGEVKALGQVLLFDDNDGH